MTPRAEQPSLGELVDLAPPAAAGGDPDADVVSVLVETPLAHLDRPFDYLVPASMTEQVAVGSRVRVRFAGRDLGGFVLARTRGAERADLAPLRRAISPVPVLAPPVARLVRAVARAHGGTAADVVRLAVPPRHAATETSVMERARPLGGEAAAGGGGRADADRTAPDGGSLAPAGGGDTVADDGEVPEAEAAPETRDPGAWASFTAGPAFLSHLAAGESPAAVVTALPGTTAALVTRAVRATLAGGRTALVVAPTARHVDELAEALTEAGVPGLARLSAEDGTARRYRTFLRALTGSARVVLGTRSAAFAPLVDLGLVVLVEDGDDRLAEPRAPYPHARDVLLARHLPEPVAGTGEGTEPDRATDGGSAESPVRRDEPAHTSGERAALAVIGVSRSVAAQQLVASGAAASLVADRALVREGSPRVIAPNDLDLAADGPAAAARIPHAAWRLVRESLATGPVLVQVARAGYVPALACARCREIARCRHCHGPLALGRGDTPPSCRWCGRHAADFRCTTCGSSALRAVRVGAARTSHELGRAFPGVPVVTSGAGEDTGVARTVDDRPRLVVATPGAEPVADGGYRAALLLDGGVATARPGLAAAEEALRRWIWAASLVRPAPDGGRVMLLGRPAPAVAQALVRWDPVGLAERELVERTELALPPAVPVASVVGPPAAVRSFLAHLGQDARAGAVDVLGPVPVEIAGGPVTGTEEQVRAVVRTDAGTELGPLLAAAAAARSARKERGGVRVEMSPAELL